MVCVLPGWAAQGLTLFLLASGVLAGLGAFAWFGRVGRRCHPDHFGRRQNWEMAGIGVGLFLVFPIVSVTVAEITRPIVCEAFGQYEPRAGQVRH